MKSVCRWGIEALFYILYFIFYIVIFWLRQIFRREIYLRGVANKASKWLVIVSVWLEITEGNLIYIRDVNQIRGVNPLWLCLRKLLGRAPDAYVGYVEYPLWVRVDDNDLHEDCILVLLPTVSLRTTCNVQWCLCRWLEQR